MNAMQSNNRVFAQLFRRHSWKIRPRSSIERLAYLGQRSTNFLPWQSARGERAAPRAETTKPVERTRDVKRLSRLHHPKDKRRHRSFIHYHEIPFRNGLAYESREAATVFTCPSAVAQFSLPAFALAANAAKNG